MTIIQMDVAISFTDQTHINTWECTCMITNYCFILETTNLNAPKCSLSRYIDCISLFDIAVIKHLGQTFAESQSSGTTLYPMISIFNFCKDILLIKEVILTTL